MSSPSIRLVLASLAFAALASAQLWSQAPYGFGAPRILRLDGWTSEAVKGDFNHDGRLDLAVINNEKARVDLILQRDPASTGEQPKVERNEVRNHPDYRVEKLVTEAELSTLVAADFDGDQRSDLAWLSGDSELVVAFQGEASEFTKRRSFRLSKTRELRSADIDGNGRADLLVLTSTELLIIPQKDSGLGTPRRSEALAEEDARGLQVSDIDGDGNLDLLYERKGLRPLALRFGRGGGSFTPELRFKSAQLRSILLSEERIFTVLQQSGRMRELSCKRINDDETTIGRPRYIGLRGGEQRHRPQLVSDIDGDGIPDLISADVDAARVLIHPGAKDYSALLDFPGLRDMRALACADLDADGAAELYVYSKEESSIAAMEWTSKGLALPRVLEIEGRVACIASGDADANGFDDLVVALKRDGKDLIEIHFAKAEGEPDVLSLELEDASRATKIHLADLDGDSQPEIIVLRRSDPLSILRGRGERRFKAMPEDQLRRAGLAGLKSADLSLCDIDGDEKPELVTSIEGIARALRLTKAGSFDIVEQLNAPPGGKIAALCTLPGSDSSPFQLVIFESESRRLLFMQRRDEGGFEERNAIEIDGVTPQEMVAIPGGLLLLGRDAWVDLNRRRARWTLEEGASWESPQRRARLNAMACAELEGETGEELVVLDNREKRVEILGSSKDGFRQRFGWKVYEVKSYELGGGRERDPREVILGDFTGDGRRDIALLVHDRLLIYPRL